MLFHVSKLNVFWFSFTRCLQIDQPWPCLRCLDSVRDYSLWLCFKYMLPSSKLDLCWWCPFKRRSQVNHFGPFLEVEDVLGVYVFQFNLCIRFAMIETQLVWMKSIKLRSHIDRFGPCWRCFRFVRLLFMLVQLLYVCPCSKLNCFSWCSFKRCL